MLDISIPHSVICLEKAQIDVVLYGAGAGARPCVFAGSGGARVERKGSEFDFLP